MGVKSSNLIKNLKFFFMTSQNNQKGATPSSKAPTEDVKPTFTLSQIEEQVNKIDIKDVAPNLGASPLEDEQIERIIARLAHRMYLTPFTAFCAIALLFLKGAASKTAPDKMFVEVRAIDNKLIKVTKGEIMQVYQEVTENRFIRRLAESLAVQICTFAERNNMKGDLAFNLEIEEVSEGREPLTPKEQAWANSFCQHVKDLEKLASPRLRQLLNKDYQSRFDRKKKKKGKKEERQNQKGGNKKVDNQKGSS